jgi:uncharacterized membrane protein
MKLARLGLALIAVGVILAFLAALLPLLAAGAGEAGVAGCVLVFFVPVCFGVGPLAPYLMVAAMLIALALLLVAYFLFRAALGEPRPESYPPAPGGT